MSSRISHLTFDCADPWGLARFWSAVTGWPVSPESEDDEVLVQEEGGPTGLLFLPVPEGKSAKNRIHLDLSPTDRTRDEEVERVRSLGAGVLDDRRNPDGTGWVVMADPEGNEFCVVRSAAERAG